MERPDIENHSDIARTGLVVEAEVGPPRVDMGSLPAESTVPAPSHKDCIRGDTGSCEIERYSVSFLLTSGFFYDSAGSAKAWFFAAAQNRHGTLLKLFGKNTRQTPKVLIDTRRVQSVYYCNDARFLICLEGQQQTRIVLRLKDPQRSMSFALCLHTKGVLNPPVPSDLNDFRDIYTEAVTDLLQCGPDSDRFPSAFAELTKSTPRSVVSTSTPLDHMEWVASATPSTTWATTSAVRSKRPANVKDSNGPSEQFLWPDGLESHVYLRVNEGIKPLSKNHFTTLVGKAWLIADVIDYVADILRAEYGGRKDEGKRTIQVMDSVVHAHMCARSKQGEVSFPVIDRWLRGANIFSYDHLAFVANVNNNHWILLVVVNFQTLLRGSTAVNTSTNPTACAVQEHKPCVIAMDPLFGNNMTECELVKMFVSDLVLRKKKVVAQWPADWARKASNVPRQTDGYNCGVYVLWYIYQLLRDPDAYIIQMMPEANMTRRPAEKFDPADFRRALRERILAKPWIDEHGNPRAS